MLFSQHSCQLELLPAICISGEFIISLPSLHTQSLVRPAGLAMASADDGVVDADGGVVDEVEVKEEDLKKAWEETAGLKGDKKVEEEEVNLPTRQDLPTTPTQLDKLPPMTVLRPSQDTHYLEQVSVLDNINGVGPGIQDLRN